MPRTSSARAASNPPGTKKRTTKRSTVSHAKVYELPESPASPVASSDEDQALGQLQESNGGSPEMATSTSSHMGGRGRARTASTATLTNDSDVTPTQHKPSKARSETAAPMTALEAVSGLYQKLEKLEAQVESLQQENQELAHEARG